MIEVTVEYLDRFNAAVGEAAERLARMAADGAGLNDAMRAHLEAIEAAGALPAPSNRAERRALRPKRGVGWTRKGTYASQRRAHMRGDWGGPW